MNHKCKLGCDGKKYKILLKSGKICVIAKKKKTANVPCIRRENIWSVHLPRPIHVYRRCGRPDKAQLVGYSAWSEAPRNKESLELLKCMLGSKPIISSTLTSWTGNHLKYSLKDTVNHTAFKSMQQIETIRSEGVSFRSYMKIRAAASGRALTTIYGNVGVIESRILK